MIINKSIREKYHRGFDREGEDITEIVLHGTGGGSSSVGLINWMLSAGRPSEYKRGIALFHYLIDLDGEVTEIISPDNWVFHSSSGQHDKNTIGIEHINADPHNGNEYTAAQYAALIKLLSVLTKKYPTINTIVGHGRNKFAYSKVYKECPGPRFRWDIIENELLAQGFSFEKTKECIYNIRRDA